MSITVLPPIMNCGDAVMSRLISFNIRVTWTETELDAMLTKMEGAVRKAMEGVAV